MTGPQSPIGSRRRLGAELRRLRSKAGLTLDEVAERMTCSTSKISRLETGKGVPKVPDVRELMRIYDVRSDTEQDMLLRLVRDGRQHGWWESYVDGVAPDRYMLGTPGRYTALESGARAAQSFNMALVPGLLQTEDYAKATATAMLPHHARRELDRIVALRLRRQDALRRPDPLRLVAVLDESVLLRRIGGDGVMDDQLDRLLADAALPNVDLRVLPLGAGLLRAHVGEFVVLDIPEELGSDVVYIEGHAGETFLDSDDDLDLYREVFDDVLTHAAPPGESLAIIQRYRSADAPPREAQA